MNGDEYISQPESSQDLYEQYEYVYQPESSQDLYLLDEFGSQPENSQDLYLMEDWPSEARFVENYQSPAVEQLQSESDISPSSSLSDILGKIIDIGSKTTADIFKIKYAQPVLKAVPSAQSGLEKSLFYPLTQTRQTGLGTTIPITFLKELPASLTKLTTSLGLPASVAGISTSYLIIGAAVLILIMRFKG